MASQSDRPLDQLIRPFPDFSNPVSGLGGEDLFSTRCVTCCFSVISAVFPRYSNLFRFSLHSLFRQLKPGHDRPSNSSLWQKIKFKYSIMRCVPIEFI